MGNIPTKQDIISAHQRIKGFIHRTPIMTSKSINRILGVNLYFKCENFQKVGAFKIRGATNAVNSLPENKLSLGVATHSSGNHAAAISLAAKQKGVKAHIVMPRTAPLIKKKAVEGYGGNIVLCEPSLKSREETLEKVVEKTGATFIHPYDDYRIIEGHATCSKEIFEELDNLDFIVAPVSGGGLLSGTCLSAEYFSANTKVLGAEPSGADDAYKSIRDGIIYPSINPNTIADGLLTSLSDKTFEIINKYISEILTVDDKVIIEAMRMIWGRMKIIAEPSGAISLAVVMANTDKLQGKNVGLIVSGGNLDLDKLPWNQ